MKHDTPISAAQLSRSFTACHRVENAIAARLGDGMSFDRVGDPPPWCSVEAWELIARSMREWAAIFGDLELYWQLRRRRDE